MRRAVSEAAWHAAHRSAFGSLLVDKPLMQNVLADLAVESEAATVLALRLAAAVDDLADPHEAALRRIALPAGQVLGLQAHAGHDRGGARVPGRQRLRRGVADAAPLPRGSPQLGLGGLRQRQRARRAARASREPEALDAWITEVGLARGADARLDLAIDDTLALLGSMMGDPRRPLEVGARRLAGRMAAVLQGSLLVRFSPAEVADVFCASRLGTSYDGTFGALDGGDLRGIVDRALPTL